jgi:hypothetical protein
VRRGKVFAHFEFAEYAAEKFSSILDLQSTPRKSFRPFWKCRVHRGKVFAHFEFAECAAKISRSIWTVKRSQLDLFVSVAGIHRRKSLIDR